MMIQKVHKLSQMSENEFIESRIIIEQCIYSLIFRNTELSYWTETSLENTRKF